MPRFLLMGNSNQIPLFPIENPLKARLGAEFFRSLPGEPGVYWMLDGRGRLLYVGKSGNLKKRISTYRSLKPEKLPSRLRQVILGTEFIRFECTESEPHASQVELELLKILKPPGNRAGVKPEITMVWNLREMPRSWRLEIVFLERAPIQEQLGDASGACWSTRAFRNPGRTLRLHGALLRQLIGLSRGQFSIARLPTHLLRGPSALSGNFLEQEAYAELGGVSADERRTLNRALKETVKQYLAGLENWPEFECPVDETQGDMRWSEELWRRDREELQKGFTDFIREQNER